MCWSKKKTAYEVRISDVSSDVCSSDLMDVGAIHEGFLRTARRAGAQLLCNAAVTAATRTAGKWLLDIRAGPVSADIVAIAAGAWADPVAALFGVRPLGIQPLRRTVVQADVEPRDRKSTRLNSSH